MNLKQNIRYSSLLLSLCLFTGGCMQSQLAKLQNEKAQLTQLVAAEKARNDTLRGQLVDVNQRAAEAERELALLHDGDSTASKGTLASTGKSGRLASFEPWVRSHTELKFDPVRRVARMPIDISFTSEDRLPFNARRELDKAADLLLAPEARNWNARVINQDSEVGETRSIARANAVVDYLKQRGVSHERLEVSTRKGIALIDEDGRKAGLSSSRVEIEFFEQSGSNASTIASESKDGGWVPAKDRRR